MHHLAHRTSKYLTPFSSYKSSQFLLSIYLFLYGTVKNIELHTYQKKVEKKIKQCTEMCKHTWEYCI